MQHFIFRIMFRFLILSFMIFTVVTPQGYNYQPFQDGRNHIQSSQFGNQISGSNIATDFKHNFNNFAQNNKHLNNKQKPLITKDVYVHVAPETPEEDKPKIIDFGPPRKHYRVIFIKTPSQSRKHKIIVQPPQVEEKTVVYVLSKKTEASDIEAIVQPNPIKPNKPEVFFIKYKTPEEAVHAQKEIQAQYDALGGSTQVADEVVSPVTSVVGSLEGSQHFKNQNQLVLNSQFASGNSLAQNLPSKNLVNSQYLPAVY